MDENLVSHSKGEVQMKEAECRGEKYLQIEVIRDKNKIAL
jgi:hypothetical protein